MRRLMGLICLMGLTGCSEDIEDSKTSMPVEVMCSVTGYQEAYEANGTNGITRAWTPPDGFSLINGNDQTIGFCLTQDNNEPIQGFFYYAGGKWHASLDEISEGVYFLYGFIPHSSGVTCTISSTATPGDKSKYSEGAVLSLKDLPAVTGSDVCVVIGAKNGKDDYKDNENYSVTGLNPGDFNYVAEATGTEGKKNYVYLLFDHLYASLRISMKVDENYAALRTIVLKEIRLGTSANGTNTKNRLNATVTLTANNTKSNPISNIVFTPSGDDEGDGTVYKSADGLTLTTQYSEYMSYFMPQDVDKLVLTSIYDVYDTKNNLIRENCKATNTLPISKWFIGQVKAQRGRRYNVRMTIKPTYLYVLSDPDLDNPTVVVN